MIYMNEIDPYCAQWLQNLMDAGVLPAGHIDTRSIEDVTPNDLAGYTQCHFFAGLGGWIYALDLAGWPRDRPVWTGSCPCQPFSSAGKGAGFADERHLWPAWQHLIAQCRPPVVFGEQVASKDADPWIDLVHADMEGMGYAFGCIPFPATGIGAPHVRDRNYWVAHADGTRHIPSALARVHRHQESPRSRDGEPERHGAIGGLADAEVVRRKGKHLHTSGRLPPLGAADSRSDNWASPLHGFWRDADWLGCTDGKWRPVEARSLALVDGLSDSLGLVRSIAEAARREIDDWCSKTQTRPGKAMLYLRLSLEQEAQHIRSIGGHDGVHSATVLLAFLRKLQVEGWAVEESLSRAGKETPEAVLRSLRGEVEAACASSGRGLDEQQPEQPANALCVLSSVLARHAQEAWPQAIAADAEVGFPIGTGSPARVGRLRAYGNAIVPQAAAEFVAAFMNADVRQSLVAA